MHSPKPNPFKYKNGRTEIESENEQKHHVRMMWFDLIMKWIVRIGWLLVLVIIKLWWAA